MSGDLRKSGSLGWRALPAVYEAAPGFCIRDLHALPPQSFGVVTEASSAQLLGEGEGVAQSAPLMDDLGLSPEIGRARAKAAAQAMRDRERDRRRRQMSLTANLRARRMQADAAARRHGYDGWARMVSMGQVGDVEAYAAHHLTKVLELVQAGAMARADYEAMRSGGVVVSGRLGAPQASAVIGYADVYLPWLRYLMAPGCRLGPRAAYSGEQAVKITLAFVVEGKTLAEAARLAKMKKANATGLLMDALRKYASIMSKS